MTQKALVKTVHRVYEVALRASIGRSPIALHAGVMAPDASRTYPSMPPSTDDALVQSDSRA